MVLVVLVVFNYESGTGCTSDSVVLQRLPDEFLNIENFQSGRP